MIKNLKCNCYCNNSYVPTRYYVNVKNNGDLYIRYILQYGIYGRSVSKKAELLKGEHQIYYFPEYAVNVCLNILNISFPSTKLIYHECISNVQNVCYEIKGTAENPICIKTTC